jgi:hypothetical protein
LRTRLSSRSRSRADRRGAPLRLPALDQQLALLKADVRRAFDEETDARIALVADPQRLG